MTEDLIERLTELRRDGKTRIQIAEILGVTPSVVKRMISKYVIVSRKTKQEEINKKKKYKHEKRVALMPDDGLGLMDRVQQILGPRMSQDHRGYLLDGRPTNTPKLIALSGLSLGRVGPAPKSKSID